MFFLSLGNVFLFAIRMLSYAMMVAVLSICLIASNMFWYTFDEFMTWFCFSGRISRVHFVVYILFSIILIVACSMLRLQMVFFEACTFSQNGYLNNNLKQTNQ